MILRLVTLFSSTIIFTSCLYSYECHFRNSYSISDSLFVENYKTFDAGVWGESTDCYITDSANFRTKIGSYDEHDYVSVKKDGNKIEVYNVETSRNPDTLETKIITKAELYKNHYSNSSCLNDIPIFGKNTIKCDNRPFEASSYKTGGGYLAQIQYVCGNDFLNAVYFTDSSKFRVFIGVYTPGSFSNNYSVKSDMSNNFYFYNVEDTLEIDTVKHATYLLSELKKGSLIKVCK